MFNVKKIIIVLFFGLVSTSAFFLFKDFKTEESFQGYYKIYFYFFLILSILFFIIIFFRRTIKIYFLIILKFKNGNRWEVKVKVNL